MTFTSTRLHFQKFEATDWEQYLSWYSNDEVMRYLTGKGLTIDEAKSRFSNVMDTNAAHPKLGLFAVRLLANNDFMGIGKLSLLSDTQAEIGYGSFPKHWRNGFATEMLDRLISFSDDFKEIKELIAVVHPDNMISKKILASRGFESYESRMDVYGPVEQYRLVLKH